MRHIDLPIEEIAARYEAGESTRALARACAVPYSAMREHLLSHSVNMRPVGGVTIMGIPTDEMVGRYRAGESSPALGRAYSVSPLTIRRRLRAAGVAMRTAAWRGFGGPLHSDPNGYLRTSDRDGKLASVHRVCWETHNRPVPRGHDVHHIDGRVGNNAIENLVCMSHGDHMRLHRAQERQR